jgi:hypothetical protein
MVMKILLAAMIVGIVDIWMSFGIGHATGIGHKVTDTTIVPSINQPVPNINPNGKPPATTDTGKVIHTIPIDSSRLIRN